ncbi:MAG: HD-GYP domain-containing protein [Methylococcales bacterium]|nr:HD-GYP domain-containing protein [Methylococcales bacterium]MDP3838327.1 HD-GYP domain-containing protein [Methylococcales bacterium]
MKRIPLPVDQLTIGMYVAELDRPWVETSFVFQGFEIKTEKEIRTIKDVCNYVYVDTTKRKKNVQTPVTFKRVVATEKPLEISNYGTPPKKLGKFEKEFVRAEKTYENAETVVSNFMRSVENGGGIDSIMAKNAVAECVESVLHSPDAMLWLSQLRNKDEYTAQHSLNVSILSIVLGRHINLSVGDLNKVGLCGMMHDVGKLLIPPEILHKSTPLDEEETRTMKTHTRLGYNLLKSSDNMSASAATVALTHHEQLDGRGYPRRMQESGISHFTKIVSIANTYDGLTSDKGYKKGKTHLEATHILTNLAGTHFDPVLVVKFIESIGVYPPGSLVEMTNGCVAMVIEVHENVKLRPKIIIILDEEKKPVSERIIDLASMTKDKNGNIYTIKNIIKARDWDLDVSQYYREGLLQKSFSMTR